MEHRTLLPGVETVSARTPTLPPATHTNSYALGQREMLLVEPATPYEDEQRDWLEWVRALTSQGREAKALLLTHHHPDHVGGAAFLARELSLPIWAHPLTAERVSDVTVARYLQDGDELTLDGPTAQRWQCLLTPGHAPGHLCFYEPELSVAVVGDMVASVGSIVIDPYDGDMVAYLAQLERLIGLQLNTAFPAHGEAVEEPNKLFRHYITHRLGREAKVVAALGQFCSSAAKPDAIAQLDDLLPIAYAGTPTFLWPLARLSLEAHLIKLVHDGLAIKRDGGWIDGRAQ